MVHNYGSSYTCAGVESQRKQLSWKAPLISTEASWDYISLDWFKGKSTGNPWVFTIKYRAFL